MKHRGGTVQGSVMYLLNQVFVACPMKACQIYPGDRPLYQSIIPDMDKNKIAILPIMLRRIP